MNMPILSQVTNLNSDDREILNQANEISLATGEEPINIQALERRNNCINHVEETIPLLENIGQATYKVEDYSSLRAKVESSATKASQNNLALAILGTTKAGKSTFQNALFGFEVALARNSAATSIPTAFNYAPNLKEPKLEVPKPFLKETHQRLLLVQELITKDGLNSVQARLIDHSQAKEFLSEIISKELDSYFENIPTGSKPICDYLEKLNDFYRVCEMLDMTTPEITEYPAVSIPFYGITKPLDGSFTVFDTPGRSDVGQSGFNHLLNQTQKIVLVANYCELQGDTFKELQALSQKIINLRGKDSLLIVVNQIDRRQSERDMSKEQVLELFQDRLGVQSHQVIEVSSLQALQASSTRRDLQLSPFPLHQIESVKQLARTYNSLDLESTNSVESTEETGKLLHIKTATEQKIFEAADEVWKASGFKNVIQEIESLLENSKYETLKAALTVGQNSLKQGIQDISATKQRLTQEELLSEELAEQLRKAISEFQTEINDFKETVYASLFNESESFKVKILSLLKNNFRYSDCESASSLLNSLQAQAIQISSAKVSEKLEILRQKYETNQSKLINLAKELKLDLAPLNWTPPKVELSIQKNIQPHPATETYHVPEQRPRYKEVTRSVFSHNERVPLPFWFVPDFREVPVYVARKFNELDGYDTIQVPTTRLVYDVLPSHVTEMINQIEPQIHNIFYSEEMSKSLSVESFNVHLENHRNSLKQKFESNLRNLKILELEAQEKLNLLSADLD